MRLLLNGIKSFTLILSSHLIQLLLLHRYGRENKKPYPPPLQDHIFHPSPRHSSHLYLAPPQLALRHQMLQRQAKPPRDVCFFLSSFPSSDLYLAIPVYISLVSFWAYALLDCLFDLHSLSAVVARWVAVDNPDTVHPDTRERTVRIFVTSAPRKPKVTNERGA
jgi:hypothetical protein